MSMRNLLLLLMDGVVVARTGANNNNNNNNNNKHDDIYSAVIMTKVIARVHSVHLASVQQRQTAADPQTKPPDLFTTNFWKGRDCAVVNRLLGGRRPSAVCRCRPWSTSSNRSTPSSCRRPTTTKTTPPRSPQPRRPPRRLTGTAAWPTDRRTARSTSRRQLLAKRAVDRLSRWTGRRWTKWSVRLSVVSRRFA